MTVAAPELPDGFSIVIPAHGRADLLLRLLASVEAARQRSAVPVEVLVIDSTPGEGRAPVQAACEQHGARWLSGTLSVRQKRNLGAKHAHHSWFLFLDSDCEASEGLFEAYRRFTIGADAALAAAAGPTRFRDGETWFTRLVAHSSLLGPFRTPERPGRILWATTSNLLVSRKVFDTLGGFREDLPFRLGGDDTDFCLRLCQAGGHVESIPDAVCYHSWQTWASPLALLRRSFRWGWVQALLLRDYPRFRRLDGAGFPIYTLGCLLLSVAGASFGQPMFLLLAPLYILLALLMHAGLAALGSNSPARAFLADLMLALVECPFGFGRVLGSLTGGRLTGVFHRLDDNDSAMDQQFPELVRDLWSDNLALLVALVIVVGVLQ